MSKTMMKKGFAWLLLAACLLTLLLPWMKLNVNGTTLWDLLSLFVPADEDVEQVIRESAAEMSVEAAEQGYALDAEDMSFSIIRVLHGKLRVWEIPRVAAAMSAYLAVAVKEGNEELDREETEPVYPSIADQHAEYVRMMRDFVAVLDQLGRRWHTEALLYWIFLALALLGAICAGICVARDKRWGSYAFFLTALALFLLNLIAVRRDNALPEKLFGIVGEDEVPAALLSFGAKFFHIGAASACFVILAALLALHARFDLVDLAGRLKRSPGETPAAPAAELPALAEEPAPPAEAEPTEPVPAAQPEENPEPAGDAPEEPAAPVEGEASGTEGNAV
ncbi:MAG: hypothetical protein IJK63_08655 [Oscillospiraceae bacterium]|nr:hypothetical protein [Oscillospiraceae bacterium]